MMLAVHVRGAQRAHFAVHEYGRGTGIPIWNALCTQGPAVWFDDGGWRSTDGRPAHLYLLSQRTKPPVPICAPCLGQVRRATEWGTA